ncbi:indole-3-acetaldehyde oxidase-like [Amyelois transitella]|uniref:Antennae-specific aldehyde oxidase 2 n=1 Tax=Amyelois transitella TaxID=680683 RepID=S5FPI8_AMYTR|nr:indole-3-acetaldehyde oxidase-like [Amyelois transitella]AGQ43599.1 antennae-specific aldehyde oxidase 2 [Amyelois transitella]
MDRIVFTVNGRPCSVDEKTPRTMSLNLYIRKVLSLPGTKAMCREGGCGACIVAVRARRATTGLVETFSVNSCLVLVFSCHGWDITTIEGLGDRCRGYDVIQKRFKEFNATQCGYCTPGWVMQMNSLQDKHLTEAELERSFGSNTCRCTGYRPILDAVKSFAVDANPDLRQKVKDIEDFEGCCGKNKCKRKCSTESCDRDWDFVSDANVSETIELDFGVDKFFKVFDVNAIFEVLDKHGAESYMFADGNTGKGIYETYNYPRIIIDISDVKSLKEHQIDQNLVLGANISLEDSIAIFDELSSQMEEFVYLKEFSRHLRLVAHIPVRKIGSLAGNLMLKHEMPFYQSDVFLLLSCVGAVINVRNSSGQTHTLTMTDFLKFDMRGMLMLTIVLPPMSKSVIFKSYKIMPRNQNALAIVNAAFLLKLNNHTNVVEHVKLAFGNITEEFIFADNTEKYLLGKFAFSNDTLQGALKELSEEIHPKDLPPEPSPECRKKLAIGLFYKFMLSVAPSGTVAAAYQSGGSELSRPVSGGRQDFQTAPELYPLNKPMPKLEAMIQSAGEAEYTNDVPPIPGEVFGAFVLATVHSGQIDEVDGTDVLKIPGVLAVYTAKDIPGKNSFTRPGIQLQTEEEEILVSVQVLYYGQPVAIVVATREDLAAEVAKKVKVTYKNVPDSKPVLTIDDAMKDKKRYFVGDDSIEPTGRGTDVQKVIKGSYEIRHQYHYYLEPISCVVKPVDRGLEIHESTQWMDATQIAVAQCLGIKESEVTLKIRRCGGTFGGKISRQARAACACALVARSLNKPCRFVLPVQTNTTISGTRIPNKCQYEVGVDNNGKIQYLEAEIIEDEGCSHNDSVLSYVVDGFKHCYDVANWHLRTAYVTTDKASNTFARAPGTCEGITHIEHIIEHIAFAVNKSPTDVRKINMRPDDNDLPEMIDTLKKEADFDERVKAIEKFNQENRWMKRDIQISIMLFPVTYYGNYTAMVTIYRGDGTVTITGGGIEMGQGLNTKAAQVCAYELGIPLDYVSVLPHFSYIAANNVFSGSSITSESVCYSIIRACNILKERLEPVKKEMTKPYTWKELIWRAGELLIDLTAKYMMSDKEKDLSGYSAFAVAILETQLDVLTGRYEKLRADILEDVGLSANPLIDVGQLEGGYIQGLGYYTSEEYIFDKHSGRLLTNRSLTYHVPLALDIPVDFRIKFRYNSKNPQGVLGSKTVGEMGICTAHGITHVLRQNITRSRKESGHDPAEWIDIDTPYTTESILKALDVKYEEFVFSP